MYASANPKQPFYVANKIEFTQKDQQVLTKLFQPLVGIISTGLYTTLINEFDSVPIAGDYKTLYQLQDQTNTNLKNIFSSIHQLEAVGLVKTYLGENPILGEVLIFKLKPVPSPKEFFNTFLLSSLLQERVGIVAFERLVKEFKDQEFIGLKNAKDISAGFFDIYHLNASVAITPPASVRQAGESFKKANSEGISLGKNLKQVDWDFLISLFASYHVPESEINKHRREIVEIISFYDLTEQEFVDNTLITLSAGDLTLDMKKIVSVITENFGQKKNKALINKQLTQNSNKNAVQTIQNLSDKDNKLLKQVSEYSAIDYLYFLKRQKGGYVTTREKSVVFRLQSQYGLSPQLINMLVRTCLEYDSVLTATLADKIANNWLQAGVTTPTQAISYMKKRRQNQNRRTYSKVPRRIRKTTNWSNYQDKNKNSNVKMSDQELNEIFKDFGKKD
ncbi:DnaD domain protein [Lactobacillus hominis]|uniref:DnaD domain protein n=1 Tax=Lactobacillus hominis TaxID=1203033 RepID=UPI0023F20A3E|nr:DnaD domain protein [Lactobacillus hominis]